ncbi:MAG TPA: DUF4040 domain-containing protein [Phycisphaerae bacterium]|nr:DUF4040 domain-containing protein [Phycisphaerae bacterium]
MELLQITMLAMAALFGTALVFAREPASQAVGISFYGLVLALMFFVFQAPDVALSQVVIGAVGLPLMVMLTLAGLKRRRE